MDEVITLNHGSGGRLASDLINTLFAGKFCMESPLTDSAILEKDDIRIAFTTDSFVVDPIFFPGGDIGKLAVCGTINDLAVSGAIPVYLSASFIIEEGFPLKDLELIVSSMANEARNAGVKIITGDTKVVETGKCDKIFINTSGIGFLDSKFENIGTAGNVKPDDMLIVNGYLGNHTIAILEAKEHMNFISPVRSDCASLNHLIKSVLDNCEEIHFMRDLTRGGLATVLNDLCGMINMGVEIYERLVPVEEAVKGLCEILGFDPLYLANEGIVLFVIGNSEYLKVLELLKADPLGGNSRLIGEVVGEHPGDVILHTSAGGRRTLEKLSGMQLPGIC